MKVLREKCWNGNHNYSVRFTIKSGQYAGERIVIYYSDVEGWCRHHASQALDSIVSLTGCKRNSIKYI